MDEADLAIADIYPVFLVLIRALVDNPECVVLEARTSDGETVFHLHVADMDKSKIIGKGGQTASALRTLLTAAGQKYEHRFVLRTEK